MNFVLRPLEALMRKLSLERKLLALLGLSMGVVMLVSAMLVACGVFAWYQFGVDAQFRSANASLAHALRERVSASQRVVNDLAGSAGLSLRLDSIAILYDSHAASSTDFLSDQWAVALRLSRVGPDLKALVVAYDRDGEPLAYFDARDDHYALGRFSSPLFTQSTVRGAEPLPTTGGAGLARPVLRSEVVLPRVAGDPSGGLQWRVVDRQLTQVSVAPVYAVFDAGQQRVGYVAMFVTQVRDDLDAISAQAGFSTQWSLPGASTGLQDFSTRTALRDAPGLLLNSDARSVSSGRFDNAKFFGRAFNLLAPDGAPVGQMRLLLDKGELRIKSILAFLAVILIPLVACAVAMLAGMHLARRQIVQPALDIAGDIDALKEGRYEPGVAGSALEVHDEISHLHGVLGELAEKLKQHERESRIWAAVFNKTQEAIFVTDLEGNVEFINQAYIDMSGLPEEQVLHKPAAALQSGLHDASFYTELWHALHTQGSWTGEVWDQKPDYTTHLQCLAMSAISDRDGNTTNYLGILSDISERKAQEERIDYLAHHDALTGLPNRTMLMDRMRVALDHAQREGHQVAVLFINLDRFKVINDTLGHSVGDGLLKTVAERLKRAVRASDTVSRLGGDEFIVMLYKIRAMEDAERMAEHILGVMAPTARVEGHELVSTPSIGVAVFPDDGVDADELIRNADVAMYQAKSRGRNNYQLYDPVMSESAEESLSLEHALHRAVDHDEFQLYYQPQIEVATRKLVGVEALIRWNNDEFRMVPTTKIIRIAEECGLIQQMGDWVLREACRQRAEWSMAGVGEFPVAVNVSTLQFRQPEFVRRVEEAMQLYGIPASQLELELTESIVMHESAVTATALEKLKIMGVAMTIDDFGTGYSSLGYLKHLPIRKLKIDELFVRGMEADRADRAIVEAIISLGRALNLTLVAEGVEQRSTVTLLGKLGCHVAQGYYYCLPLPPEDFLAWYKEFSGEVRRTSMA